MLDLPGATLKPLEQVHFDCSLLPGISESQAERDNGSSLDPWIAISLYKEVEVWATEVQRV